jgi:transposase InsO family protein
VEVKLRVVEERMRGTRQEDVARAFGVSVAAVTKWLSQYRKLGRAGLEPAKRGGKRGSARKRQAPRERVVALKREHETWGTRKIRDVLARFEAIGVSEQQVRRILHEEGLIDSPTPAKPREHGPRRFERARPNQLWQSDIFTFRLRRAERLYVCVFMDDHSRFVVGHALAHHQKSALVMEAFERGIAAYGQPEEVLTDNGRQYTVWRGKTEFEELLARMGVHHIRSRPQHPQTLGKVERFWKTLWDEFLGRTVFAHVVDAQRRLEHFLSFYNFQRPHQALGGLVPADRFFQAAAHVRAEIERAIQANELRLALEQPPRKPFYVVGQLGDQRLSIAAGATGLEVLVGDKTETIPLKEDTDGTSTARRFHPQPAEPADPTLADHEDGSRCGGEEPRDAGAVGAVGREAGHDGDRGGADLARLLLPARDQGAERDAAGAGAGRRWRSEPGRGGADGAGPAAGVEAGEGGGGAATGGAAAVSAAQARARAGEDAPWPASEDDNLLDAGWAEKLALLDDDEADEVAAADSIDGADATTAERVGEHDAASGGRLDPHAGWRERGPERWERKLAGADASIDNMSDAQRPPTELYARPGDAVGPGDSRALRDDREGAVESGDGGRGGAHAGPIAQSLPVADASRDLGDDRGADAQAGWAACPAGAGGGPGGGEPAAAAAAGSHGEPSGDHRADDGSRERDRFWQDARAAIAVAIEEQEADERQFGSRTRAIDDTDPRDGGENDA